MRRILAGIAVLAVGLGLSVGTADALHPRVTVKRSTQLDDHQKVHVLGKHFPASQEDLVQECNGNFVTDALSACDSRVFPHPVGSFKIRYLVRTGPIGTDGGTCGTSTADNHCVIAVMPVVDGVAQPASAITVPISFFLGD